MSDQQQQQSGQPQQRGFEALKQHVLLHKIDSALWASRVLTIIFAIGYVIPIFGNATSSYYKVLMANAATSALRLHQRMPPFQLSRAYLQQLLLEDSCHYLLYSLIFLYVSFPVLLIIFPVALFAVLHSASYSLTLLDTLGQNSWWGARLLISLVEFQTRNILRLAAFAEIFIMPLAVVLLFMGKAAIMTPLVYYQFLVLRYSSRRNPYTRNVFYELRLATENFANGARTPEPIRKILQSSISIVSRLAPPMQQQQQ
ncbi:Krueppel homolog 2 [Uranotaenia lowii]|uniref:Krueppel homolog 2 n=1 Tax=Uranotaenia lowii TaxID=190385 RepID=UPI002478A223|nr:Krueppel homolog 2 [Uranotaenia lowii]XP_055597559.1 Krueppel homolog 2 [Uranotaenia lowii]XP_055597560.1 Krueppel homolog 2 [Uranotaenia lowii]XP_055597561.1 Krueppel homolog 2 [Uranotaenia lowii]XP_055597562.1 Krueppel homolog 2 [Uranotaenia lowii]